MTNTIPIQKYVYILMEYNFIMGVKLSFTWLKKKDIILYCKVVNPWKEGEVEKTEGDSSHQHYSINSKGFPSPSSKTI